jgi:ureidoglycolate lyase
MSRDLPVHALTRDRFRLFGDVIEKEGAHSYKINGGTTTRFHDLARVETAGTNARTLVSIFRGDAFDLPVRIAMLERHPLGSQAFFPLQPLPWLVVVAPDESGKPGTPQAFVVRGGASDVLRGVNYHRNVWHHPLISLEARSDFLVVDRGGDGSNLEEHFFDEPYVISRIPSA